MTRQPKPTIVHNGRTYKVRSHTTKIPDLTAMSDMEVAVWLVRHTYPRGTNHRRPAPNLAGLNVVVR